MTLKPHNTAITRSKRSVPAAQVARLLLSREVTILDYGCGKGTDVAFYAQHAKCAAGYDQYSGFGFNHEGGGFDIVTMTYVLNVIPTWEERVAALKKAADRARTGGYVVVSTRSPSEIDTEAKKKGWAKHGDGYLTSKSRQTFQRGIGTVELQRLASDAGLVLSHIYNCGSNTACIEFRKTW